MATLEEWLFGAPWWLIAMAASGSLALLVFALARRNRRLKLVSLPALGLCVLWGVASYWVETPTETSVQRTREMVRCYEQQDWNRLSELVDDETHFAGLLRGREIVEAARLTHEAMGLPPVTVTHLESVRDDIGVVVNLRVRAQPTNSIHPFTTGWRFDYRRLGDTWRLERIDPVATEHVDQAAILRNVRLPPEVQGRRR